MKVSLLDTIPVEVLLAAAYALFLITVSAVLERLAKHSHRRSEQYEVAGFRFHRETDRWECPTGQHLRRSEVEHDRRIVRYNAPASACNVCHIKANCTDSETGREIEQHLDSWLTSEIRRFHHGISLALLLLAALLLIIEAARYREPRSDLLLGFLLVPVAIAAARLILAFSSSLRQVR